MAEAEKLRAENTQLINKVVAMKVEQVRVADGDESAALASVCALSVPCPVPRRQSS